MRMRARLRTAAGLLLILVGSTLAEAKVDRILHEPIPDELYRALPQDKTGAARPHSGGPVTSGQAGGPPSVKGAPADKPAGAAPSGSDEFTIDRDTRRPNVLPYSDPFEPSVAPFKRLHAYDQVAESYVLSEGGEPRHEIIVMTPAPNDVVFKARLTLTVESGVPLRLPTPGPGARLLAAEAVAEQGAKGTRVDFTIRGDAAENWDFETTTNGPIVLTLRVAVAPDAFGGDFGDPSWESLPVVPALPRRAQDSAAQVTRAIGASRTLPVREAVRKLVAYFRSFAESNEPPPPSGDVYLDLALSKKGVCRHRAFAFFVTARSLGIPTRVLTNEAHAWVEVHNGTRWKRIDLGGAGGALEAGVQSPMTPPPDPFAWPESANRGSDLASRAAAGGPAPAGGAGGAGGTSSSTSSTSTAPAGSIATAAQTSVPAQNDPREKAVVEVLAGEPNARRGGMLPVRGTVRASGRACPHTSVVISLREVRGRAANVVLGVVPARDDGTFESSVFVPRDVPTGDYEVLAQTPGDSRCGTSE